MNLHESGQMYLETILVLSKKSSAVRSIDIVEHMGYSKPSVSRAVGLLKNGGFIVVDKDGYITLTPIGKETAEKIYERHTVLTAWLVKLGVDPETAAEDACRMEHTISDTSIAAIKRFVEG
ncbi:MAG: metal-dependent transcriptional regulator [Clostridia bacterium]|nr:metal-dependent transcriptional regulator [Clostridia bacterium]